MINLEWNKKNDFARYRDRYLCQNVFGYVNILESINGL